MPRAPHIHAQARESEMADIFALWQNVLNAQQTLVRPLAMPFGDLTAFAMPCSDIHCGACVHKPCIPQHLVHDCRSSFSPCMGLKRLPHSCFPFRYRVLSQAKLSIVPFTPNLGNQECFLLTRALFELIPSVCPSTWLSTSGTSVNPNQRFNASSTPARPLLRLLNPTGRVADIGKSASERRSATMALLPTATELNFVTQTQGGVRDKNCGGNYPSVVPPPSARGPLGDQMMRRSSTGGIPEDTLGAREKGCG
ncbi:hypothetical protein FIBSPDRAFT_892969 [Athelia psychrophila]|uniref:Uncharacterized protein n=1 Tax=Athelia psychrophila TaxID=1759441 RepID=A0A166HSB8_9AGAM|nr:hypothetical protein FIBSPDRAFT_892969 [Fibularhizoctonia sp. CBS 109695]